MNQKIESQVTLFAVFSPAFLVPQVQPGISKQSGRSGCSSDEAEHFIPEAHFRQRTNGDNSRSDSIGC